MRARRIYYDKTTGEVIKDTGETSNPLAVTLPIEEEVLKFSVLSERNRETFDVLQLEYGQYSQDFIEGRLIGVDLETKIPIFEYPNTDYPTEPIVVEKPLTVQIEQLKLEQAQANSELVQLIMLMSGGKM